MNRYLSGAIGGIIATLPMTVAMVGLFRSLPRDEQYPLPPREITEDLIQKAGVEHLDEEQLTGLSLLAHFAYGGLTGALYPLTFHHVKRPLLWGSGYGLAIWGASYLGWIPALNVLSPATHHPANRRRLMIGVHIVWGASTVLIGERLSRQRHGDHAGQAKIRDEGRYRNPNAARHNCN